MYMSSGAEWITFPNTTWSTCAGSMPARSSAASTAVAPRSVVGVPFRLPPVAAHGGARRRCDHYLVQSFPPAQSGLAPEGRLANLWPKPKPAPKPAPPTTPTAIFGARMRLHHRSQWRCVCRCSSCPPAPWRADTPDARRSLYRDGPSGRYLLDGVWYHARDPGRPGPEALQRQETGTAGWQHTTVPSAANAGDFSDAELHGNRALVPQGLPAARALGGIQVGAALRVGQLPRAGVAERQAAGLARRRLPAVRDAREERSSAAACNRLVVRVDSRREEVRHPAAVAARSRAPSRAAGGTTTASCARSTCGGSTRSTSSGSSSSRSLRCARCAARVEVQVTVANVELPRPPARDQRAASGAAGCASTRKRVPGRGEHARSGRACGSRKPRLWWIERPYLYTGRLQLRDGGRVRAELHGPHRHPQPAGQPPGARRS